MIDVMIIDDNEALRLGLRIFVEEESDMRVVGEFVSAAVSLSEVEGLKPDIVLLSVGLPDMTGFEACRKILNLLPSTRIACTAGRSPTSGPSGWRSQYGAR